MNAGPWLPVPPAGYGGIENVIATLVPQLRRRGVRVLLCTVADSTLEVDERISVFDEGQFPHLAAPYPDVVGIAHAHMHAVIATLRVHPEIDVIHDHLELVGPSMLSLLGPAAPPALQTLHWDLSKHPDFYRRFDGRGRVFFNAVSSAHLATAPANLRAQCLDAIPLGVPVEGLAWRADAEDYVVALGRITPKKGTDVAARVCKELGLPLVLAGPVGGLPTPEALAEHLRDPASPFHDYSDVRYYRQHVADYLDGEQIRWVGTVGGARKEALLGGARALLMPIRWEEPGATAAIESLACGTPVVGFRRGALPTIVEHGVTGFLADDERELAGYLQRLDELDRRACRRAAEERFSDATMAERYLDAYGEVIRRAHRAGRLRPLRYGSAAAAAMRPGDGADIASTAWTT